MSIPVLPPPSQKAVEIGEKVKAFLQEHIIPAEHTYHEQLDKGGDRWTSPPIGERPIVSQMLAYSRLVSESG